MSFRGTAPMRAPALLLAFGLWPGWAGGGELEAAMGLAPNLERGKTLYQGTCVLCHMFDGRGLEDGSFPRLAGQHASVVIKQLADMRAGRRYDSAMKPFVSDGVLSGPQALADVAAYINSLQAAPENSTGSGEDLARGEALYRENCAQCHGAAGEGNAARFYPRIQGQHFEYLLRQFRRIRDGRRDNAHLGMVLQIIDFSEADAAAVIDFVARLRPDAKENPNP